MGSIVAALYRRLSSPNRTYTFAESRSKHCKCFFNKDGRLGRLPSFEPQKTEGLPSISLFPLTYQAIPVIPTILFGNKTGIGPSDGALVAMWPEERAELRKYEKKCRNFF